MHRDTGWPGDRGTTVRAERGGCSPARGSSELPLPHQILSVPVKKTNPKRCFKGEEL